MGLHLRKAETKKAQRAVALSLPCSIIFFKFDLFWGIAKWKGIGFWYRDQRFESFYPSLLAGFSLIFKKSGIKTCIFVWHIKVNKSLLKESFR